MDVMEMELDLGEKLESEEEGEGDGMSDVEKEDARLLCIYTLHIQVLQDLYLWAYKINIPSSGPIHLPDPLYW